MTEYPTSSRLDEVVGELLLPHDTIGPPFVLGSSEWLAFGHNAYKDPIVSSYNAVQFDARIVDVYVGRSLCLWRLQPPFSNVTGSHRSYANYN